ncbi:MAG: hypothetical protein PHE24_04035 [Patescibacteria group bacterium]|nr:hypothetical protein [Patescibacteria group bacterium]
MEKNRVDLNRVKVLGLERIPRTNYGLRMKLEGKGDYLTWDGMVTLMVLSGVDFVTADIKPEGINLQGTEKQLRGMISGLGAHGIAALAPEKV